VKILLGKDMGFSPAAAMMNVDVIKGKPCIAAQAQAARMKQFGYFWTEARLDDKACVLMPTKGGEPIRKVKLDEKGEVVVDKNNNPVMIPATVSFTIEDAKRAGLIKPDSNWTTYPMDMMFWRTITRIRKRYAPETLNGLNIQTIEEMREAEVEEGT